MIDMDRTKIDNEPQTDEQTKLNQNADRRDEIKFVEVKPKAQLISIIGKIITAIIIGFIFGWAMEKAKVYEPQIIKDQMIFKKYIMLKMFLAALATSTLSTLILSIFFKNLYNDVFKVHCDMLKKKSAFIVIFGAGLLGLGMQIAGACPGTVLVQLGAGVDKSYITLIGAFVGALLHGLVDAYIMKSVKPDPIISKTIAEVFCHINPAIPRVIIIILLGVGAFLLELLIPWTNEYANGIVAGSSNIFIYKAWPPAACGVIIGLLQFFAILILRRALGTSSSYSTIVSVPFCSKNVQEKFPYLAKYRVGLTNWLSVVFVCSAILGSFVSSFSSNVFGTSSGTHFYNAFFGGLLMVFGARIAGGCTSGHGISGTSHELIGSFLATASMFAGAIFLGFYTYFS